MGMSRTTRRQVLRLGAAALPLAALASGLPSVARAATAPAGVLRMPEETDRHVRTYMAWPALSSVWGGKLDAVRSDIAEVAYAISRFEPVVMLARPDQAADARYRCGRGTQYAIDVIEIAVDDPTTTPRTARSSPRGSATPPPTVSRTPSCRPPTPTGRWSRSASTTSPPAAVASTAPRSRTRPCPRPSDDRRAPGAGRRGPVRRAGAVRSRGPYAG
ncbi:hypothetical protein Slala05_62700 [Streptomyces lavendulae subsp. lavendulae]|nr:hypothetical protein Slala05_62700 [Streptomyces lavendulae subsp. lavendulae]